MLSPLFSLNALGPFEPSPTLAVALSGGADSMACVLLADAWVRAHNGRVIALTVDHRLRTESADEATQVAQWMQARSIEHHILTPHHTEAGNNLQQAARQWRYDALAEWCRAHGVLHCLVAQHADDQRETAYLQQARGDTADGGAGMSAVRAYRGVRFLRPLLGATKSELEAYLHAQGMPWVDDSSNQRREFARVRARQYLASHPAEAHAVDGAIAAASVARITREQALADAAMRTTIIHPAGFATIDRGTWLNLPAELAGQLLADTIRCIGGEAHRPRRHETERLAAALQADNGKRTLGGCQCDWRGERLTIAREPARVTPPMTLTGRGELIWDRRFHVTYDVAEPLTLAALGAKGRKLASTRLPLATPALWHLDELHAIPHIGWNTGEPPAVRIGFAPAKPLAAQAFWWFTTGPI